MNKKWNTDRFAKHEVRRDDRVQKPQENKTAQPKSARPKNYTRSQKTPKEIELLKQRKGELTQTQNDDSDSEEDEDQLLALAEEQRLLKEEQDQGDDLIKIESGLFLGTQKQVKNNNLLERFDITHVLTVLKGVARGDILKEKSGEEHILHKIVEIEDFDTEEFSTHFDECADFIHEALEQSSNNVLVHDDNRISNSRSGTAIMSYLIRYRKLTVEEALQKLTDAKSDVEPNEGFMKQLNRYYVKQRRLQRESAEQVQEKPKQLTAQELREQRVKQIEQSKGQKTDTEVDQDKEAYCKRCRHELFSTADLAPHSKDSEADTTGLKGFSFKKSKKDVVNGNTTSNCNTLFINRMPWMGEIMDNEGKLICPKCAARLGSYSWSGSQCSCGMWINPSFAVLKTRVD